MSTPGEDALRVGAIILIVVAGVLLICVFIAGVYRLWKDHKHKKAAKRAAQERLDFESVTYDLGLDEIDRLSVDSNDSLYDRQEPEIQELHFPVTRANEVHMASSLQTVGHLNAFTNVSQYYNDRGWGMPSQQAMYKGEDTIVETDFSKAINVPPWHTGASAYPGQGNAHEEGNRNRYLKPREVPRANAPPMNNFVALQIASQNSQYSSPNVAHKKPRVSPLSSPAVRNQMNSERVERRPNDTAEYQKTSVHANAYFIGDNNRLENTRENLQRPNRAQNVRENGVYGPYRTPVLGKDAEYWHYVASKTKTPTPDLSGGRNLGAKKGACKAKSHKAGKNRAKQHDAKIDNARERGKGHVETRQDVDGWDKATQNGSVQEDFTEDDMDKMRPLGRTERSLSTKKKEDLLVSELKAKLGKRHGVVETEEMIF